MLRISLVLACAFSACAPKPPHVKASKAAIEKFHHEMKNSYALEPIGSSMRYHDGVSGLFADYRFSRQMTEEVATGFLETCMATFLDQINHDETLVPYLAHVPFTRDDISLSITFPDGAYVLLSEGNLAYKLPE